MSRRANERIGPDGSSAGLDITDWGGVPVAPAAAKADGQSNAAVVPEIGARAQSFNGTTWDRIRSGFASAITALGFQNVLPMYRYLATPPPIADGTWTQPRLDSGSRTIVTPEAPASYDVSDDKTSGVLALGAATLFEAHVYNSSASTRFFQLFDSVGVPLNGTVPSTLPIQVEPSRHAAISFSQGKRFLLGITWASSTTRKTKTETVVTDMWVNAQYRNV